jgi:hypothetical protein
VFLERGEEDTGEVGLRCGGRDKSGYGQNSGKGEEKGCVSFLGEVRKSKKSGYKLRTVG